MSVKNKFEAWLRGLVSQRFEKVREFEQEKFIDEAAQLIAAEAHQREFSNAMRHKLLYKIQQSLYPGFVIADDGRVLLEDSHFRQTFEKFSGDNWTSFERKWNLKEFLRQVRNVPGDFAECGVFRGGSAYLMCEAAGADKHVHLFDSYEGLSKPDDHENFHWSEGDLSVTEETVRDNLDGFENFSTYKGWIPERFADVAHLSFSLVHIDVDLEQPTRDSIEFLFPKLSPGGVLLLDDHGSAMCPGARQAALDYFATRDEEVLDLATGQGLVIKAPSNSA